MEKTVAYSSQLDQLDQSIADPGVVAAARRIYETHYRLHGRVSKTPIGVAVDAKTYRGQLLFTKAPILLPGEYFIPMQEIKA